MEKFKNVGVIQRKKKYPESYDEYLEMIYRISIRNSKGWVKNKEISERLGVKPSSVSNMLAKLKKTELIDWKPREGTRLTIKGKERAREIITNHIIIELFLNQILHFSDRKEVERVTCNLEHYFTDELKEGFLRLMDLDFGTIKNIDNIILEDKFPEEIRIHQIFTENQFVSILKLIQTKIIEEDKKKVVDFIDNLISKRNFQSFLE